MQPQIGDEVVVNFFDQSFGSMPTTAAGTLGVELDAEGRAVGIVVESDGGAVYIPARDIVHVYAAGDAPSTESLVGANRAPLGGRR